MITTKHDILIKRQAIQPNSFAEDVRVGLSRSPKRLSSMYFYDERGSELFEAITRTPEYYPTRCEHEILRNHASDIADQLGDEPFRLIELGAGDGQKTDVLLDEFVGRGLEFEYMPIDICGRSIANLEQRLRVRHQARSFQFSGMVGDSAAALLSLPHTKPVRSLILFLGSSIGNFDHSEARKFLTTIRRSLAPDDLALIGFDLKKSLDVLLPAYDDAAGVTREFNLNLLDRMNRELGANFDRNAFNHRATYNFAQGCMESWLVSDREQIVSIPALDCSFRFAAWEGTRVERSYKYDLPMIEQFAAQSDFRVIENFHDDRGFFTDSLWRAV